MYGHFIQFTIPKIGQALVAVVLYLNFLKLPFVACFAGAYPAVYLLLPLLLLAVMSWIGRDPLGPGMIVNSHLTGCISPGTLWACWPVQSAERCRQPGRPSGWAVCWPGWARPP